MNPFHLDATGLMIWGLVAHLIADWPLQNDWMANNKASLKHPAAYVHSGIQTIALAFVFGWVAILLGILHLLIDTRKPVIWWSRLMNQTQPRDNWVDVGDDSGEYYKIELVHLYDVGTEVRLWTDQMFHIACIAVAALVIG